MEFKTLRNIENSFKQIRLYALVFAVLCGGVVGYALWLSYSFAEKQRQKVYVLDSGKSLMLALSQDASINRPVEASTSAASMSSSLRWLLTKVR
jgi:hypothetical protein